MTSYPALRIAQLDSEMLDSEFLEITTNLLDHNLGELSDSIKWQRIYRTVKSSVPMIYYFHQCLKGLSPGQSLMGVQYTNFTRIRAFLNFILNHIMPSVVRIVADESHNVRLQRVVRYLESIAMLANLLHFFYFLSKGGPSNLVRRILNIQTVHLDKPTIGEVNFANLNRELLGHSIASLILLLRPLCQLAYKLLTDYLEKRRKVGDSSEYRKNADGLILCDKCKEVVVLPVSAITADQTENIFCNYCYYVAKRSQDFVSVKLFKYGAHKIE
ncbi:Peroxisome biogenesis factor 2 [Aphelenchoides bicaudatus]|nr:Peroxisome biogenesis factor 2 [Aphelenchoides bicaudatus]